MSSISAQSSTLILTLWLMLMNVTIACFCKLWRLTFEGSWQVQGGEQCAMEIRLWKNTGSEELVFWVLLGDGTPLQYSCLGNPMEGGAWWAAVHGVAKSRTQLSDFTFTFHFHALEKEMATHSSVLAWRIPGTGEPGGLPSMGSPRVGHDWSDLAAAAAAAVNYRGMERPGLNHLSLKLFHCLQERSGNPLQYSCLENPMDKGAWWATVHGVAKSWTWLSDSHTHILLPGLLGLLGTYRTWNSDFRARSFR